MKVVLLFCLLICVSFQSFAATSTYEKASELSKKQLHTYLESVGYISGDQTPLDFMEENEVRAAQIKCTNEAVYDVVYIGNDSGEHSGMFAPGTTELKGEISKDAVFLYEPGQDQIDCFEQEK